MLFGHIVEPKWTPSRPNGIKVCPNMAHSASKRGPFQYKLERRSNVALFGPPMEPKSNPKWPQHGPDGVPMALQSFSTFISHISILLRQVTHFPSTATCHTFPFYCDDPLLCLHICIEGNNHTRSLVKVVCLWVQHICFNALRFAEQNFLESTLYQRLAIPGNLL